MGLVWANAAFAQQHPNPGAGGIDGAGVWDVDLESWIEIADSEHRSKMASLLEPATPIGFSGRSGAPWVPPGLGSCRQVVSFEQYQRL